jgi:hypothetical protein
MGGISMVHPQDPQADSGEKSVSRQVVAHLEI